jgi:hypothetical protein
MTTAAKYESQEYPESGAEDTGRYCMTEDRTTPPDPTKFTDTVPHNDTPGYTHTVNK